MATLNGFSSPGQCTNQHPLHSSLQSINDALVRQGIERFYSDEEDEMKGSVTLDLERSREEVAEVNNPGRGELTPAS